jgi:N-methylhydantoinase A/oxoprolinase/acetone carboxylase beta subunit
MAGGVRLDAEAARRAVEQLATRLDLSTEACAAGIVRVANVEMLRALRVMTVEQGVDPRAFALLAFGGAGGLHACEMADELGITAVLVPRTGGVLSALGLAAAERREDSVTSVLCVLGEGDIAMPEGDLAFDLRYRGQSHELTVRGADDLRAAFEALHEERYGYRDPDAEVELVSIRATRRQAGPDVELGGAGATVEEGSRPVLLGGEEVGARVLRGEPGHGAEVAGPAVVELPGATVAVPPGWSGTWDADGTLRLERS